MLLYCLVMTSISFVGRGSYKSGTFSAFQERLEETDDPASLARARQWDDYKDHHKRGEGNRYNRS